MDDLALLGFGFVVGWIAATIVDIPYHLEVRKHQQTMRELHRLQFKEVESDDGSGVSGDVQSSDMEEPGRATGEGEAESPALPSLPY